jgi:8-oxo-dGTP pyrophosphatase MutT (NUDIX family)
MAKRVYGVALMDSLGKLLIVQEYDPSGIHIEKWGFPKGKRIILNEAKKICRKRELNKDVGIAMNNYEDKEICRKREFYEEVGIDLNKYEYDIIESFKHCGYNIQFIRVNQKDYEIPLTIGKEIRSIKWILLPDLQHEYMKDPHKFNNSIKLAVSRL